MDCGFFGLWIFGLVDFWTCGFLEVWIFGFMDFWTSGFLNLWICDIDLICITLLNSFRIMLMNFKNENALISLDLHCMLVLSFE